VVSAPVTHAELSGTLVDHDWIDGGALVDHDDEVLVGHRLPREVFEQVVQKVLADGRGDDRDPVLRPWQRDVECAAQGQESVAIGVLAEDLTLAAQDGSVSGLRVAKQELDGGPCFLHRLAHGHDVTAKEALDAFGVAADDRSAGSQDLEHAPGEHGG
jgi:hypothetical protein